MKRGAAGTRSFILIILISGTVAGCSEKFQQYIKRSIQDEHYIDPFAFIYYPATLMLQNGDTIKGRFTKYGERFHLLHENPDSNYHCDKKKNRGTPVDYYYKKYLPSEIKAYVVKGQRYEPVFVTYKKTDVFFKSDDMFYEYMIRLTPDSSSMHLYKHFELDERNTLALMLFPADTMIDHYGYYIQFFLHFPDELPVMVWRIDSKLRENKRLKGRLTETFRDCPALAETLRNIEQVPNNEYILLPMLRPDSTIKSKGLQALLDRIELFDACYKKSKQF